MPAFTADRRAGGQDRISDPTRLCKHWVAGYDAPLGSGSVRPTDAADFDCSQMRRLTTSTTLPVVENASHGQRRYAGTAASAMRAFRPAAGPAQASAHLVDPHRDTPHSGGFLLGRSDPANPLVTRQRGDGKPKFRSRRIERERATGWRRSECAAFGSLLKILARTNITAPPGGGAVMFVRALGDQCRRFLRRRSKAWSWAIDSASLACASASSMGSSRLARMRSASSLA